jgi:hypothetical protein
LSRKRHHIKPLLFKRMAGLLLALFFAVMVNGQATADQVKAVFLYHFTQFVEWPSTALPNDHSPFIIGILGADPFGSYIDATVEGEKVGAHPIVVKRYKNSREAGNCQILFISENYTESLEDLNNKSILTVSDEEHVARSIGMIRFRSEHNNIRLRINLKAARAAGLTISSKLLRVADVIE